ncbi:MAG: GGDEF domain-containing protein [Lawsonibacter sp.]|nr:GGDEF domain-containing protein [Lawsonibacter sp.]
MKIPFFFKTDIQENIRKTYLARTEFKDDLILQNIQRGKLLAVVVLGFETIFLLIDVIACLFEVNDTFAYYVYLTMYSVMIGFNVMYLYLIRGYDQNKISLGKMNICTVLYLTLVMSWGSVISLMDQKLYGQLMSFMVNMIICSIIYLLDAKRMSIPYLVSTLILGIGLPFVQKSSNILIGHSINLCVFIVVSWTASRIVYRNYCDNYVIKELMNQSKLLLEKEMEENRVINEKLAMANAKLKKLALVDELTGLPNRRSFREFIDRMFQNNSAGMAVSVIMIDVDYFKQYNDTNGHEKGDLALREVAKQIDSMVESTDQIAVRWGGEEFIYIAFQKNQENILEIADALRLKILGLKIPTNCSSMSPYITVSLGVCKGTISSAKNINKIINIADQALYLAKNNGRNRVAMFTYKEGSDMASS